jgi:uncharacterized protein YacL
MTDTLALSLTIVGVLIVLLGILRLRHVSIQTLMLGLIGAIVGLLLSALASVPLGQLPKPAGGLLAVLLTVAVTVGSVAIAIGRRRSLLQLLPFLAAESDAKAEAGTSAVTGTTATRTLLDTSAVIDGRIADIAEAGFAPGILVASRFMLAELQNIADSDDAMRRGRGRRGLEVLNRLREIAGVTVEVTDEDVQGIREVDAKLVVVAQRHGWNVLTTDYNLNRVAAIQGVKVLNVNELSNAIRPVVLPGEPLMVRVVQPGKERNQGVGYLADGTMIVVENGDKLMGQEVETEVTRVFQTVAGKMIFAVPRKPVASDNGGAHDKSDKKPSHPTPPVAEPKAAPAPEPKSEAAAATDKDNDKPAKPQRSGRYNNRPRRNGNGSGNSNGNSGGGSASIEERLVRQNQSAERKNNHDEASA